MKKDSEVGSEECLLGYSRLLMKFGYLHHIMCVHLSFCFSKHFSLLPFSQKQTSPKGERAVKGNSLAEGNFQIYKHFF